MSSISEIPDHIKALAEASSMHNRHADKIWIVAATITIFVITSNVLPNQNVRFFGFEMDAKIFYPASAYLLGFLNISYCAAHAQAYRVAEIFSELVMGDIDNAEKATKNFNKSDIYYSLIASNFNRIYPLTHTIPIKFRNAFYVTTKSIADLMFMSAPSVGFLVALLRSDLNSILSILSWLLFAVSTASTVILLSVSFRWIFTREHAVTRQRSSA